jgi:alcohol dehydrogenase YqhD (iron-dependent ADH family)
MFTLPAYQTAAGTADIMSHVFEQYFQAETGAYLTDRIAESIVKTCVKYCPVLLEQPDNYEARANLMWASSLAVNGLPSAGKSGAWVCHPIEHELSAFYDITHGVGLAVLTPRWMRYTLNDTTVDRFAEYAANVWGVEDGDKFVSANKGIDLTEQFFKDCGIPMTLGELGIGRENFDKMAEDAVKFGCLGEAWVPLGTDDVKNVFEACL